MAIEKGFTEEEFVKEVMKIRSNNLRKFVAFYCVQILDMGIHYFTPEEWEMVRKNPKVFHRLESRITRRMLKCGRRTAYDYRKAKDLVYRITQEQPRRRGEIAERLEKIG